MVNGYRKVEPALERTAAMLAEARSVDEVVEILRLTARRIAGSDGAAIVLRDGPSCFYAAEDAIEPLWRGSRFLLDDCVSGWAMLHGETVVIPDIAADPRVPRPAYANKAIRSLVMVRSVHRSRWRRSAPIGAPWSCSIRRRWRGSKPWPGRPGKRFRV